MLQLIVYSLLMFLTLLAICDIIGSCMKVGEENKERFRVWSAPYNMVKNRLKGMKTLKEEQEPKTTTATTTMTTTTTTPNTIIATV